MALNNKICVPILFHKFEFDDCKLDYKRDG